MSTITLYHGTPKEFYCNIVSDGVLAGPVFLTPNKSTAEDYAANNSADYVVFEVEVEAARLGIDPEFVSEHSVEASLKAGSVRVDGDVSISNAVVTFYEDYTEV